MPENRHIKNLLVLVYLFVGGLGLWVFFAVLLPWLLPFLIALALAWLMERPVRLLVRKFHLKRWIAAALCTLALILLLCGGLWLILWRVGYELALLLGRLPTLLAGLPTMGRGVERWAYRFIVALPLQFQDFFQEALVNFISQGIALPGRFYDALAKLVGRTAAALPSVGLFLFTTALATYFSSASRPELMAFLRRQVPERRRAALDEAKAILRGAFGHWLRAQGLLMLITFGLLTAGFLLLRVDLALLLAALVALVDALPVFGTGTVLIPWAAFSLLSGNWRFAVGLVALYALVSFFRSLLEPRLVGRRVGLHPLAALLAMYVGFSALGVPGMIGAPLAAVFLKQLHDSGVISLWRQAYRG